MTCTHLPLDTLLGMVQGPNVRALRHLLADYRDSYAQARGSSPNHQAWPGGFWDHTTAALNIAHVQYQTLAGCRPLPFPLSDALLILACHDLEKMVRYAADGTANPTLDAKADKAGFRLELMTQYGIVLSPEQANAMRYAEGVRDVEYRGDRRQMGPLAALVHCCDLISARVWFNHPLPAGQGPWADAQREHPDAAGVQVAAEAFHPDGTSAGVISVPKPAVGG